MWRKVFLERKEKKKTRLKHYYALGIFMLCLDEIDTFTGYSAPPCAVQKQKREKKNAGESILGDVE